jgi:hypothetical protein
MEKIKVSIVEDSDEVRESIGKLLQGYLPLVKAFRKF